MNGRAAVAVTLVAIVTIAAACDRGETRTAPVTSTSPAGTSTAPSSASASHRDEALMRVVNAAPANTNFDLFAGDLLLFDGLSYKAVTPYRAIDGERYAFALRPAGMSRAKPLASNTEDLKDGQYYTAFAMPGTGDDPELRVVSDHLDQPASDKARLRVVHAAAGTGDIRVRAAGANNTLFDNTKFQAVSDYQDVAPINGAIEILGDASAPIASVTAHLEAGRFYTLVVIGNARAARPEAFLIEDALAP